MHTVCPCACDVRRTTRGWGMDGCTSSCNRWNEANWNKSERHVRLFESHHTAPRFFSLLQQLLRQHQQTTQRNLTVWVENVPVSCRFPLHCRALRVAVVALCRGAGEGRSIDYRKHGERAPWRHDSLSLSTPTHPVEPRFHRAFLRLLVAKLSNSVHTKLFDIFFCIIRALAFPCCVYSGRLLIHLFFHFILINFVC